MNDEHQHHSHTSSGEVAKQTLVVPPITCQRDYEAALAVLRHLAERQVDVLERAYKARVIEWEDRDYLFED